MNRARVAALGVALLASYLYFHDGGGWSQNSRFDLVLALIERHTVCIDAYHGNTGDRALYRGHYYCDKAPGTSFVALPAVLVVRGAMAALGTDVESPPAWARLLYIAEIAAARLPGVLGALCLWWLAYRFTGSEHAASVAALAFALGSPMWTYGSVLLGHTLSVCCLLLAWSAAALVATSGTPRRDVGLGFCAGLAAGAAVVTEYPVAVASVVLAGYAVAEAWSGGWAKRARVAAALGLGAASCALVLMAYHQAAFGSPFRVGYQFYDHPVAMKTGLLGINRPQWHILAELLWGWYRGLLPTAPVLVLAPVGFFLWIRRRESRIFGLSLAVASLVGLAMMSGDVHWEGGWAYGPRYLAFIMGFLFLGVAPVWTGAGRLGRAAILVLALAGVGASLVAVSTTCQPDGAVMQPMRSLMWPAFRSGDLALNTQGFTDRLPPREPGAPRAAWNLGQLMGLTGLASLVPLLAVWAACAALYVIGGRRHRTGRYPVDASPAT